MVVGPEGVVDAGVPALVGSNNVVGGEDWGHSRNSEDEADGEDEVE